MLKELTKIANKLDGLGLTKEADLLDNIISKMAGMGEGPPAYMSAGSKDSELQMTEDGELEYPEERTLMQSRTLPPDSMRSDSKLSAIANDILSAIKYAMDNVWKLESKAEDDVFDIKGKVNKIGNTLVRSYANDLDSKEDVRESIMSLLSLVKKDKKGPSPIPMSPNWAFFGEEEYHLLEWADSPNLDIQNLSNAVVRLKRYFDNGFSKIEDYKDVFKDIQSESAYKEMYELEEIVDPAANLVYKAHDIVGSVKPMVDKKYEEFKKLLRPQMRKGMPFAYLMPPVDNNWRTAPETSPEQARFEQSQIPIGDADVGDADELDWYVGAGEE